MAEEHRQAGKVLGAAIADLKGRVTEVEGKEPNFMVPVPSVENVPDFPEFPEIDIAAIVEAISKASVGDKLDAMGDKLSEAATATSEAQASFQQVMVDLIGVITDQQTAINSLVSKVDAMGANIVNVLSAPKELVLDSDGDPIGVQIVGRTVN